MRLWCSVCARVQAVIHREKSLIDRISTTISVKVIALTSIGLMAVHKDQAHTWNPCRLKASMSNMQAPFWRLNWGYILTVLIQLFLLNSLHLFKTKFHLKDNNKKKPLCILKNPLSRNKPFVLWESQLFIYFMKCKLKALWRNHQKQRPSGMPQISGCI